jgi:outer membrane protein TolC
LFAVGHVSQDTARSNARGHAQAAYYPTLNLAAVAGLEGSSLLNWFNWPSRFWAVGPSISETLFDRTVAEISR